jgi:MFS family permease
MGFAISAGIIPMLSDMYGRKWLYRASLIVQTTTYAFLIASKSINYTIIYYFVVGLCAGGRVAIGTIYLSEFVPSKYIPLVQTVRNCTDACVLIFQSVYYYFNKNWYYLHVYGLCLAVVLITLCFFIPESPKYLYVHGRYEESRQILKLIARRNKAKGITPLEIGTLVFDTEISVHGNSIIINLNDSDIEISPK